MTISESSGSLTWAHIGDLHITAEHEPNYRDFQSTVEAINTQLAGQIDFCVLPGDNADDGSSEQYELIRRALERLQIPIHVLPGDHDRKPGNLDAFYQGLKVPRLPNATTIAGYRCLFLDVVSEGSGGPDFALGLEQLRWLESQLQSASRQEFASVVFMHAYPADLKRDGKALLRLLHEYRVAIVDMGHTHYNELANDGTTIFGTTRSTGQIEEGPVGFSLASLHHGVVSWRFKPLRSPWPFVMITSPADHRSVTDLDRPGHVVAGPFRVTATPMR
jgi:predicted phosphodiesterase